MNFRFAEEEEAFQKEVQDFLQKSLLADWLGGDSDGHHEQAVEESHQFELEMRRRLAAKGWLQLTWPKGK
jgi:alkylation response protein AidB-like acyl-CoA dehydrogenase